MASPAWRGVLLVNLLKTCGSLQTGGWASMMGSVGCGGCLVAPSFSSPAGDGEGELAAARSRCSFSVKTPAPAPAGSCGISTGLFELLARVRAVAEMDEEEPAGRQIRLKEEIGVPGRRRVLHLAFARPAMSGRDYEGTAWKPFSILHVHLGGYKVASLMLPAWGDDMETWWRPFELPMDWQWPRLCLCLEAVREDYCVDQKTGRVFVFRTEEPHTSGHTSVMGAAIVPLLDALVLGDDDEYSSEKEVAEKRRLEQELNLAKGTHVFQERVKLQGWGQGGVGGELTNVVCGSVVVILYLSEHDDADPGC